jgi:hypothetical protein
MEMVFGQESVRELKTATSNVLNAVVEKRSPRDITTRFLDLAEMWDSPGIVLFRRSYGNAAASMPDVQHLQNWTNVVSGINNARAYTGFIMSGLSSDEFFRCLSVFYTGLSVLETAHIDDINDHYKNN